ncbi:MAG: hypothetical protein B7C24_06670 [Bacteroidetes bacterium 4572_77]|nr:MAG: hypothetical protein B7C24_06670 [Bacteroidetes bacterium 4572_77]
MTKKILILLLMLPLFMEAQNFVLPQDAEDNLAGKKGKTTTSEDDLYTNYLSEKTWQIKVEYQLQYQSEGMVSILAKDDNDYFGYALSYGFAADDFIWFNKNQLKPWLYDAEYKLYKNDSLQPIVSKISARLVGNKTFVELINISKGVNILDNNLLNISSNDQEALEKIVEIQKELGNTFAQGALFIGEKASDELKMYRFVFIDKAGQITSSPLSYRKELKVVSTTTNSDCCCENISLIEDPKARAKVIKKWKSILKSEKKKLKKAKEEATKEQLEQKIAKCEAQLEKYN